MVMVRTWMMAALLGAIATSAMAGSRVTNGSIRIEPSKQKRDYFSLAKVSLEEAIAVARKELPGTAIEAELEREDGFLVYSVKIVAEDKSVTQIVIDAGNKAVLARERDGKL